MTSLTTTGRATALAAVALLCCSSCASGPRGAAVSASPPLQSIAPASSASTSPIPEPPASAPVQPAGPATTAASSASSASSASPAPTPATPAPATPAPATPTTPATSTPPPPTTRAVARGPTGPTTCPSDTAQHLSYTGSASQLITVESPSYDTTYASLSAWRKQGACWVSVYGPWTARIGAGGFSDHKSEGDDTTPAGSYGIGPVMYGNAANPGVSSIYHRLVCGDWWDEDPSSTEYNTFQHLPCGQQPPFGGDSEALWTETTAYPSFAVVDYNTSPTVKGAGSAIFIHADVGGPTAGCVSLPRSELDELLDWLDPHDVPLIVMGPGSELNRF